MTDFNTSHHVSRGSTDAIIASPAPGGLSHGQETGLVVIWPTIGFQAEGQTGGRWPRPPVPDVSYSIVILSQRMTESG